MPNADVYKAMTQGEDSGIAEIVPTGKGEEGRALRFLNGWETFNALDIRSGHLAYFNQKKNIDELIQGFNNTKLADTVKDAVSQLAEKVDKYGNGYEFLMQKLDISLMDLLGALIAILAREKGESSKVLVKEQGEKNNLIADIVRARETLNPNLRKLFDKFFSALVMGGDKARYRTVSTLVLISELRASIILSNVVPYIELTSVDDFKKAVAAFERGLNSGGAEFVKAYNNEKDEVFLNYSTEAQIQSLWKVRFGKDLSKFEDAMELYGNLVALIEKQKSSTETSEDGVEAPPASPDSETDDLSKNVV